MNGKDQNYKVALNIALCALFGSFLFIDEGMIGRLRPLNIIILIALLVMTVVEIAKKYNRR